METTPKHMKEASEQVEDVDKSQAPVTDSPSMAQGDGSGKVFLRLVGMILVLIVVISIGATSCGTAARTTGTDSDAIGESTQNSDTPSDDDSDSSSADNSGGYSNTRDYSDDYSYDHSDRDYSSTDDDDEYQRVYDEDSGIYGVIGEDGDGIFAGEDFGMRLNEDGSSIATDGNGNWVVDSDGDGEADSVSIDGGNTWL